MEIVKKIVEKVYNWIKKIMNLLNLKFRALILGTTGETLIPVVEYKGLKFTAQQDNTSIYINKTGTPVGEDLYYSYNGMDWYELPDNGVPIGNTGDYIYIKGNNPNGLNKDSDNYISFHFSGKVNASGNVNSLLDNADGYSLNNNEIPSNGCYYGLFYNSNNLATPPELPATTLKISCYWRMFWNCYSLVVAPELPALNLANSCYYEMFAYCTSLIQAPELPATTLANGCYSSMFSRCTNMEIAPSELPATILTQSCYNSMFSYCEKITQSPIIHATTLESFSLNNMFYHCASLNNIKLSYTGNFDSTSFSSWVDGVAATGDFYYDGTDTTEGVSAIPTGWTIRKTVYTYTVNSIKNEYDSDVSSNCTVTLTASGYTQSGNSITVPKGTLINVFVSGTYYSDDYQNYCESLNIDSNISRDIIMKKPIKDSSLSNNVETVYSFIPLPNKRYEIELCGGKDVVATQSSTTTVLGGKIIMTYNTSENPPLVTIKAIKGGGCGIGLWLGSNTAPTVVAGGAAGLTIYGDGINAALGGGGYTGGRASGSRNDYPGYSYDGTTGDFTGGSSTPGSGKDAEWSGTKYAYGGKGYTTSGYTYALTTHNSTANFKITRLT